MPDPNPPIFIDRNSGGKAFRDILVSANLTVALHDDWFDQNTPDEVWVKDVAQRGYVMVTGDKLVTRRLPFLKQMVAFKARVFVLYGLNGVSPQGKAGCILSSLEVIKELISKQEPPTLWRIAKDNISYTKFDHQSVMGKMYANRRQ